MATFDRVIQQMKEKEIAEEQPKPKAPYASLGKGGYKLGDVLISENGERYRVGRTGYDDEKVWGTSHVFLKPIDEKGNERMGVHGWFPLDSLSKFKKL